MEAAVLVGQETQEFLALQGTGSDDHFIAAAGEDFQSHVLTVFVEQARYGVVGLVLDDRRRRIAVDGQGAEPFPVAHVGCEDDDAFAFLHGFVQAFRMVQCHIVPDILRIEIGRIEDFHERLAEIAEDVGHDAFRFFTAALHAALYLENTAFALLLHQFSYERA